MPERPRILAPYEHPVYGTWLTEVERPARYVLAEFGAAVKPRARYRMVLAFPDVYEIGMSHMGLRILYQVVNREPDLACERAFAPWPDMEARLRRHQVPLVSLETARPLKEFHLVGFSLQYELTYTNLLTMLELGGIPIWAKDRSQEDPIIVAGGPVATHAEPLAPFLDALVVGDAERLLPELLRLVGQHRERGASREEILAAVDVLDSCYVPARHEAVTEPATSRLVVTDALARIQPTERIEDVPPAWGGPVPSVSAVFDRISIEIMRGCTQGCRFCQAGMLYRPLREQTPEKVAESLVQAARATGWDEASLTGLSPADHSELFELFDRAARAASSLDVSLSVSSLRAYGLPGSFLDDLRTGRGGGLTFAPEAGTQRLRDVINKNVRAEDLLETAAEVSRRGWSRIKLYFMLGLPTETDEDLEAIADLSRRVWEAARRAAPARPPTVTCSVSTFVPKPHTPFQWCEMIPLEEIQRRQTLIRRALRRSPVRTRFHDPHMSLLEGVFSRGDRRLARALARAQAAGCRFDGWEEHLDWDTWLRAFDAEGIAWQDYLAALPTSARLSWDYVRTGTRKAFLRREYERALQGQPTPPCSVLAPETGRIVCHGCGAPCDLRAMKARLEAIQQDRERRPTQGPPPTQEAPPESAVARLRIRFSKTGPATLWGHLDLVRHLARTFRRAGVAVAYTQGFHPKPRFHHAAPLPLGASGVAELADVDLRGIPEDLHAVLQALNAAAPPGLAFTAARLLEKGEPPLARRLAAARYEVELLERGASDPEAALAGFLAAESYPVVTERKGKARERDLKACVSNLHLGAAAEVPTFSFVLRLGSGVSPAEVVQALFAARRIRLTRLGFLDEAGGDPFLATG